MISEPTTADTTGRRLWLLAWMTLPLELAVVGFAPALLQLARYFSWGAGAYRLCTLVLLFATLAWVTTRRHKLHSVFESRWPRGILGASVLLLVGLQARTFVQDIREGPSCITDMGRPTVCAGEWLLRGLNPWAECVPRPRKPTRSATARSSPPSTFQWCSTHDGCIDRKAGHSYPGWTHHGSGLDFMDGYKYGPLMALTYLPATHVWIERGIYATNLAFWLATLVLLMLLARAAYPELRSAPWRALLVFSLPATMPFWLKLQRMYFVMDGARFRSSSAMPSSFLRELTLCCSNDMIPVALGLAALLFAARRRSLLAGVMCGLSLAAKPLPAPLLIGFLLGLEGVAWKRLLVGTLGTATLAYLPFFLWSPREMFANLVLFGAVRPTNSSSIRAYLPPTLEPLMSALQLGLVVLLPWLWLRAPRRDLRTLLQRSALLVIAFVAFNKIVHSNYLLWIHPLVSLALAGLPFAPRSDERAVHGAEGNHQERQGDAPALEL